MQTLKKIAFYFPFLKSTADEWDTPHLLLGGPLFFHWIWGRCRAWLTSLNFSSCQPTIRDTNMWIHARRDRKGTDLPGESLSAEFQSCPQNSVESALGRICPGRPGWPTPVAPIPVVHTHNHASRLFWEMHFLSVRWTDQYHTWTWLCSLKNYVLRVSGV